jgi:hypothetical protein
MSARCSEGIASTEVVAASPGDDLTHISPIIGCWTVAAR